MRLPLKQRLFVIYYLGKDLHNGTAAARRAGFSSPRQMATRLLSKASIKEAIEEKVAAAAMDAEEVLARISDVAATDADDFYTFPPDAAPGSEPQLDLRKARRRGKLTLVKEIKPTEFGLGVKLHDSLKALDMLAKVHGLYKAPIAPPDERKPRIEIPRRDSRSDEG